MAGLSVLGGKVAIEILPPTLRKSAKDGAPEHLMWSDRIQTIRLGTRRDAIGRMAGAGLVL
jgi:hypothetical protein